MEDVRPWEGKEVRRKKMSEVFLTLISGDDADTFAQFCHANHSSRRSHSLQIHSLLLQNIT
jgi:hypothetical protein